jgi:hypothetical protein
LNFVPLFVPVVGAVVWELGPPDEVEEADVKVELGCNEVVGAVVEVTEGRDIDVLVIEGRGADVLVTASVDVAIMPFDAVHQ